ncbi:hypothetical protein ABII15_33765 [Streptomyces sp. HUAS MG91]|uniref:Lipoprotein n=1 Tax=Streptomyces tabacisoli TaxID=3156398 RepID=A0AAU8J291_9ACTN
MHRRTRRTTTALAAIAVLTAVATACSGSTGTPKASSSKKTAGAPPTSPAQRVSRPNHEQLDDKARRLLGSTSGPDADDDGFIASGTLATPGQNLDETIEPGTALRVEVACAGEGTVTFTVVSGTARAVRRVNCAQSVPKGLRVTTAEPHLAVRADSATPETVGAAYVVRRADRG